jgi:nitroreductase
MKLEYQDIKKAIIRSQHCQRNWDLTQDLPQEDLELFAYAVSNCPSKQNVAFYNVYFITNRELIEKLHSATQGFYSKDQVMTNTQTLANLLIVFTDRQGAGLVYKDSLVEDSEYSLTKDRHMAVGIAAGYVNLLASMLGYSTGCCACFDPNDTKKILEIDDNVLLMMGVGYKDENRNRREHHLDPEKIFPTIMKEPIRVKLIT